MSNWWHIAHTPTGVHAHQLDPVAIDREVLDRCADDPELAHDLAVAEVLADEADRIRTELGFPIKGRWIARDGWDSSLSPGEPHPKLLAAATIHRADQVTPPSPPAARPGPTATT